jgi:hypothetical protein
VNTGLVVFWEGFLFIGGITPIFAFTVALILLIKFKQEDHEINWRLMSAHIFLFVFMTISAVFNLMAQQIWLDIMSEGFDEKREEGDETCLDSFPVSDFKMFVSYEAIDFVS